MVNMWPALLVVFSTLSALAVAQDSSSGKDIRNPLQYLPNAAVATVGLVLMLALFTVHTFLLFKSKAKYLLVLVIAELCYAIGIVFRYPLRTNPDSLGVYIMQNLFTTLSPCGFIAAEYVLLGRLALWLQSERHLFVKPEKVTKVFVISDVVTFLIQATGGGISATGASNPSVANLGSHLFLVGLILQLISFVFFTTMFIVFIYRVRTQDQHTWSRDNNYGLAWYKDWRSFAFAIFISCIGVLVRSVYRCIELSEGYSGHLTTTEIYFWVLDFLPLYIALLVYVPFWPARFLNRTAPAVQGYQLEMATPELHGKPRTRHEEHVELYGHR